MKRVKKVVKKSIIFSVFIFALLSVSLAGAAPSSLPLPQQAKGDSSFFLNTNEAIQWEKGTDTFILQLQTIEPERALLNLVINGESRRFFIKKGTPLNLDVTGDKQPDGSITLITVLENKGEFKMTSVTDVPAPATQGPISSQQQKTNSAASSQSTGKTDQTYLYYIIGALVVLIIILAIWVVRRRRF
jgi:LPXTG-motif cell wall-anchored protein